MAPDNMVTIPPEWMGQDASEISADRRISFGTPIMMISLYLLIIYKILPSFMNSRPAYKLKNFITVYNIYQIIACTYLIKQIYSIDLPALNFGKCVEVEQGTAADKHFDHIASFMFWLKTSELIETIIFVLRKKQNQVTFLHVFHHCAVFFLAYNSNTIYRNSTALFTPWINSIVHVIMYTYYLMAAVLPSKIVALLTPFKKIITTIQMIQFAMILLQVVVVKIRGCKLPKIMLEIYTLTIVVIFYGFYDFYKKTYTVNNQVKQTEKEENR